MSTLTVKDLTDQGYTREHAEGYVAMLEGRSRQVSLPNVPPRAEPAAAPTSKEVRAWAVANDIECPARGRVPGAVLDQFNAAH